MDIMNGENGMAILRRLIESSRGDLSPAAAQGILQIHFTPADQQRVGELAGKSNFGTLSSEEAHEYDGYIEAADLLSLWKSKARRCLSQAAQV